MLLLSAALISLHFPARFVVLVAVITYGSVSREKVPNSLSLSLEYPSNGKSKCKKTSLGLKQQLRPLWPTVKLI